MKVLQGKSVFGKVAFGRIRYIDNINESVRRTKIKNIDSEIARYNDAVAIAVKQLEMLYDKAKYEVGESNAEIFNIHKVMLTDEDYENSVLNIIKAQKTNAEFAVMSTCENFCDMFSRMEDAYIKERARDIKDISDRLIQILSKQADAFSDISEPCIISAQDLSPSETVKLDKTKIIAFVTSLGSENSHTAILARSMGVPAIIGVDNEELKSADNKYAVIDGFNGQIFIEPDDITLNKYMKIKEEENRKRELLLKFKGLETKTKSGKKVMLYANISEPTDVISVLDNDGEGIGLFRSEFLYLKNYKEPTSDEQFEAYKTVAENMGGKRVIIRTMDIGADKKVDYLDLKAEENPALGYRAIRICLDRPRIFKTQLNAILRASAYGKISIMLPMITSTDEVRASIKIIDEIKEKLKKEHIPFDENIEIGIMVETPAAALIAEELSKYVDFFSIGTNDLTQYTIACDRQNTLLDKYYNATHDAVMKLIKMTVDSAHKMGKWVGVCGELAGDLSVTEKLIEYGVDELSVSPPMLLSLKEKILSI